VRSARIRDIANSRSRSRSGDRVSLDLDPRRSRTRLDHDALRSETADSFEIATRDRASMGTRDRHHERERARTFVVRSRQYENRVRVLSGHRSGNDQASMMQRANTRRRLFRRRQIIMRSPRSVVSIFSQAISRAFPSESGTTNGLSFSVREITAAFLSPR